MAPTLPGTFQFLFFRRILVKVVRAFFLTLSDRHVSQKIVLYRLAEKHAFSTAERDEIADADFQSDRRHGRIHGRKGHHGHGHTHEHSRKKARQGAWS